MNVTAELMKFRHAYISFFADSYQIENLESIKYQNTELHTFFRKHFTSSSFLYDMMMSFYPYRCSGKGIFGARGFLDDTLNVADVFREIAMRTGHAKRLLVPGANPGSNFTGAVKESCEEKLPSDGEKYIFHNNMALFDGYGFPQNWFINIYITNTTRTTYSPYEPVVENGWQCSTDIFVIKLPRAPHINGKFVEKLVHQNPKALASFYALFPTLLGNCCSEDSSMHFIKNPRHGNPDMEYYLRDFINSRTPTVAATNINEKLGLGIGGPDSFYAFSSTLMTILAKAWVDDEFMAFLEDNFVLTAVGTPESIFRDGLIEFRNPWNFIVRIEFYDGAKWDVEAGCWLNLEYNTLFLTYPFPSLKVGYADWEKKIFIQEPISEQLLAVALSRYNNTGPTYPFSCC